MDLKVKGKRALVTGSSSGLGKAIAVMLAAEGIEVIIHGRDEERTKAVAATINQSGGKAGYAIGDLTTDEAADRVVKAALEYGQIDILVNNAGVYRGQPWMDVTPAQWLEVYNTNVVSGIRMAQRLLPQMRGLGWGRVVQIGGITAIQPTSIQPDYNAAMAARHNLTVSLARDLKGSGITSNTVAPGAILVDSVKNLILGMAEQNNWGNEWDEIEKNAAELFLKNDQARFGKPEEVAAAVAYLMSSYADHITGSIIRVDGGQTYSV
ncbi:NAD(P)-dependent dehydrogenase, short-chain alcohol dehydrogenase family [Pedobacter westerhofensis]|uniref:NAD(P)-dependent dehydrogenase, short-chain alcohol dehydrogenase family n=1 Tax=Pedobacter westerhofensis TaxID=425512 RepID=A0A521AV90_9SPHI|nr:SDR family NAD(P)-dependent oxidoreductase [Pedobacter westerhofensis]SMO38729.1 NAD(P)-dependent dehydrogenase, short-chain alcohol dehydrogenase family [Pedobacter westerhofensis]